MTDLLLVNMWSLGIAFADFTLGALRILRLPQRFTGNEVIANVASVLEHPRGAEESLN